LLSKAVLGLLAQSIVRFGHLVSPPFEACHAICGNKCQ
jgi:hypothetical protein